MAVHKISVSVDARSIRVTPDPLSMSDKDDVHWAGTGPRKFSIVFDDARVFGKRELSHSEATSQQRPKVKGSFKYTVVAADDPGLVLDPEIIIGDPPSDMPNP